MRPLHLRLIVSDAQQADFSDLVSQLRAAGHTVVTRDEDVVPPGVSPLPDLVLTPGGFSAGGESLDLAEAQHIQAVLRSTGGNRRQSALLLGVARSTLLAKIRRYGL